MASTTGMHVNGHYNEPKTTFRDSISREPGAKFPPEKGRYCLYISRGCPFAHRVAIVHHMKGLAPFIDVHLTSVWLGPDGWYFTGDHGSPAKDPLYGFATLGELYKKADPAYAGRVTVPVLWDSKHGTIVNNESAEIARMLYTEFDDLLPEQDREPNRPGGGFYPPPLRAEIDALVDWMAADVNLGVYKAGFAVTQEAYEEHLARLFAGLDALEARLAGATRGRPFLLGAHVTEADVRLFATLIRFDAAYHTVFLCNLGTVRHDYPRLHLCLRRLYWDAGPATRGAFRATTEVWMGMYARAYAIGRNRKVLKSEVVVYPKGPAVLMEELEEDERVKVDA